jgi:hypothetical protein
MTAAKDDTAKDDSARAAKVEAALKHLIVTLEGAPGVSPYTQAAIEKGKAALEDQG